MKGFIRPIAILIILAIAAIMVGNFASAVTPPEDHIYDLLGCYCHNAGVGIWVNGTPTYAAEDVIYVNVESGGSFAFFVESGRVTNGTEGLLQPVIAWMPNMADNARFKFDPQEVADNSAQDQDPAVGGINALFRIAAPNESGSYVISLSVQGPIVSALIKVKSATPEAFASISSIESPSAAKAGALIGMNVTLKNTGQVPLRLYVYAVDRASGQKIFDKVYSEDPVSANGTMTLDGGFSMPEGNLTMMVRSGHVEGSRDVDDDALPITILQPNSLPAIQTAPLTVLVKEWIPWVALIAVSLGSVPMIGMYARRGNRFFPKGQKVKVAFVERAGCSLCKSAIKSVAKDVLDSYDKSELTLNSRSMANGHVDVTFVVGSIRTEEDVKAIRAVREKTKLLVAFGACSAFGELSADERRRLDAVARGVREQPSLEALTQRRTDAKPLSDYVKVDLVIPGCPPPLEAIRHVINSVSAESFSGEKQ
jgi:Ni,Fe-hydrogenase III small subunit